MKFTAFVFMKAAKDSGFFDELMDFINRGETSSTIKTVSSNRSSAPGLNAG
ncbi:hypothetical protein GCM10007173_35490 [Glutamicibacter ardleyensis]|uniref:Uncharacterized protein n=1 Tax=Glutamicibacter ardleyensis TaxID=225894 RepID=A0ABQ2DUG5_9MICC|nr:hypothetical protein GCM10007173_35490 [Glutamicibacter ardleyensis]